MDGLASETPVSAATLLAEQIRKRHRARSAAAAASKAGANATAAATLAEAGVKVLAEKSSTSTSKEKSGGHKTNAESESAVSILVSDGTAVGPGINSQTLFADEGLDVTGEHHLDNTFFHRFDDILEVPLDLAAANGAEGIVFAPVELKVKGSLSGDLSTYKGQLESGGAMGTFGKEAARKEKSSVYLQCERFGVGLMELTFRPQHEFQPFRPITTRRAFHCGREKQHPNYELIQVSETGGERTLFRGDNQGAVEKPVDAGPLAAVTNFVVKHGSRAEKWDLECKNEKGKK